MLNDITFGQYYPANSVMHRIDARIKILLTIGLIVLCFVARVAPSLILVFCLVGLLLLLSKVPLKMYLKTLKPIIPIILITSIINALYVSSGTQLFSIWKITVTTGGVLTAVYMSTRICLLILTSSMLTYTTTPTDLTDAIERLLSPLKWIKLDVHALAMMMTIALRFIPTLIEETEKIMSAQKARGADVESGGLMSRIRALIPILIPLLISSFRRASELADAMECRCYHGGDGRTRMKQLHLRATDFVLLALLFVLLAGVLLANHYLSGVLFRLIFGELL
ncbi:MAG: energy-coupling factor transporter transmembrane protein EcfT [Clostridia bacterium]|nr:energy-coupling factor transporter transmembrane protein EcfT [Clostridia bacterium]